MEQVSGVIHDLQLYITDLIKRIINNFQKKVLSHKCSILVLERLFVTAAASGTSGQGRELRAKTLCICFLAKVVFTFDSIYGKVTFSNRVGTRRYVYRHLVCYWADLN